MSYLVSSSQAWTAQLSYWPEHCFQIHARNFFQVHTTVDIFFRFTPELFSQIHAWNYFQIHTWTLFPDSHQNCFSQIHTGTSFPDSRQNMASRFILELFPDSRQPLFLRRVEAGLRLLAAGCHRMLSAPPNHHGEELHRHQRNTRRVHQRLSAASGSHRIIKKVNFKSTFHQKFRRLKIQIKVN